VKSYYVYIMANNHRTTYVGVTNNLERRVWEHKTHYHEGFTKRYNCTKLVHIEEFASISDAIAREKQLKGWLREKKSALIQERNPRWNDLAWNWTEQ